MSHRTTSLMILVVLTLFSSARDGVAQTAYAISLLDDSLISFDLAIPGTVTTIGAFSGASTAILGLDFRPADGRLYGYTIDNKIVTIDRTTAVTTLVSTPSTASSSLNLGVDFNPAADRLRLVNSNDQNLRINVATGATLSDGTLAYSAGDTNQFFNPRINEVAYTNSDTDPGTGTQLYYLDPLLDILATTTFPNTGTLTTVGSLGVDTDDLTGFDILTNASGTNSAFAVLHVGGSSKLYGINLGSGAAAFLGNVGNANDPATGGLHGGVGYAYNIRKTEVTVGEYTEFLNAVADTDTHALYNTAMATDLNVAGISRDGVSGSYSYGVIGSPDKPVTYVSWGDAARFSNWLHNNQPTGQQDPTTTERGAYTLDGAVTTAALNGVSRDADAQWVIPTENEWYKAAYHKNDGATGNYWDLATSTDAAPFSDQPPGSGAPTQSNTANFFKDDSSANGYDDGYAVTGSNSFVNSQNYLTDVGAYTLSASPYGTFDQGGNVYEWNEALISGSSRGIRGGSWSNSAGFLPASDLNDGADPANEFKTVGFRVASIPGLPGDYNNNGTVDAADYTVWRNNVGQTAGTLRNDTVGGPIGRGQYDLWKANYGTTAGGAGARVSVPEPSSLVLLMFAAAGLCVRRARSV